MKLLKISVEGIGRFVDRQSINVGEKTVAIVGPNEAGKSTLLRAIASGGSKSTLDGMKNRDRTEAPVIEFLYAIEESDTERLAARPECAEIARVRVTWKGGSATTWQFEPHPVRSTRSRELLHVKLLELGEKTWDEDEGRMAAAVAIAVSESKELSAAQLETLRSAFSYVVEHHPDQQDLREQFEATIESESSPNPAKHAIDLLDGCEPECLMFGSEHRDLKSFYTLLELAAPTPALRNVAAFGLLDIGELVELVNNAQRPKAEAKLERANLELRDKFNAEWNQSGVFPRLTLDSQGLFLSISTEDAEHSYTNLEERSDGFRAFIALRCFLASASQTPKPILLIDEVEPLKPR